MKKLITGLWLVLQTHEIACSLLWMNIASVGNVALKRNATTCSEMPGFVSEQRRICESKPLIVPSIRKGVLLAMRECKKQLSKERWNCSTMTEPAALRGLLSIPSKETAFVYALTSAAVAHAVTKSCTAGKLPDCSCQSKLNYRAARKKNGKWKRSRRCDENVGYGLMFSELFVDAPDQDQDTRRKFRRSGQNFVNLHNSNAGRQAVLSSMKSKCRCHGGSHSCVIRTCWKMLSKFSVIGNLLKKKYKNTVEVMYARRKNKLKRKANRKLKLDPDELVFMNPSPNYCRSNPGIGISGTSGRVCEKNAQHSMNNCALLCCGNGYNTRIAREKRFCNCLFMWCCRVECQTCERVYDKYTCK